MAEIRFEDLGLSTDDITDRLVERIADRMLDECPENMKIGTFGLWKIERVTANDECERYSYGYPTLTILSRFH